MTTPSIWNPNASATNTGVPDLAYLSGVQIPVALSGAMVFVDDDGMGHSWYYYFDANSTVPIDGYNAVSTFLGGDTRWLRFPSGSSGPIDLAGDVVGPSNANQVQTLSGSAGIVTMAGSSITKNGSWGIVATGATSLLSAISDYGVSVQANGSYGVAIGTVGPDGGEVDLSAWQGSFWYANVQSGTPSQLSMATDGTGTWKLTSTFSILDGANGGLQTFGGGETDLIAQDSIYIYTNTVPGITLAPSGQITIGDSNNDSISMLDGISLSAHGAIGGGNGASVNLLGGAGPGLAGAIFQVNGADVAGGVGGNIFGQTSNGAAIAFLDAASSQLHLYGNGQLALETASAASNLTMNAGATSVIASTSFYASGDTSYASFDATSAVVSTVGAASMLMLDTAGAGMLSATQDATISCGASYAIYLLGRVSAGNTTVTGTDAFASGLLTQATGNYSFAANVSNVTSGQASAAFGSNNIASGPNALAVGFNTTASGSHALAQGSTTIAAGNFSNAAGYRSKTSRNYQRATAGGAIATEGDAQAWEGVVYRGSLPGAAAGETVKLGAGDFASEYIYLEDGKNYTIRCIATIATPAGPYSFAADYTMNQTAGVPILVSSNVLTNTLPAGWSFTVGIDGHGYCFFQVQSGASATKANIVAYPVIAEVVTPT